MAVLSKIRQRSVLLVAVIGFCLFAFIIDGFVRSDLFHQQSRYIGKVNGDELLFEDFRKKVDDVEKGGQGVTQTQAVNRVWDETVSVTLLTTQFDKLGIRAGESQVMDVMQQSQDIGQNPQFQNAAGKFDKAKFDEFVKANPQLKPMLAERKKSAELNAKFQIWSGLIKASTYTTTAEGKLQYALDNDKVSFDYVSLAYSTIKDSDVKISDQEITDYMKKHEKQYKSDEVRELEYVVFDNKPSAADENAVKDQVNALMTSHAEFNKQTGKTDTIPSFKNAKNNAEFVNNNSDVPFDSLYVAKKDLPAQFAETLYNLPAGEVYGPYMDGQYYSLTKSLGRQAGVNARASHILIAYKGATRATPAVTRTKEEAAAKANELLAQINANPNTFMTLAFANSEDPGSKQQGGDLGYFGKGQMTPKFNDFVFNNPVGKVGVVETEFGFHIIKVTDKQDGVKLATIKRKIEASEKTTDDVYTKAAKFEMDAQGKSLDAVAKTSKLTVAPVAKVKVLDESFGTIGNQRTIIKWAFDKKTELGSVKRFDAVGVGSVVVKLKKIDAEGLTAVADARPGIEPILKNKKKAEMLKKKLQGSDLDAIAKANAATVSTATDLTAASAILPTGGQEQRVVATAFSTAVNKVSAPIEGVTGVFVVRTKAVTKAPDTKIYTDQIAKLNSQNQSATGRILGAMKDNATIDDNRKLFY